MSNARPHATPLTLDLVVRLNNTRNALGMSQEAFRVELNKNLPASRKIKDNHSGMVKLNRWLNPTSNNWTEPKSEIALAFQKTLDELATKAVKTS